MKAYFRVHSGPVFDLIKDHLDKHRAANDAKLAWSKEKGLPIQGISGTRVWFKDGYTPDRDLWKKHKKEGYLPRLKTEGGKAIAKELEALPNYPSWWDFMTGLTTGRKVEIMRINQTGTPGMSKHVSEPFYRLCIDTYWLPEDRTGLEEITASQYGEED